MNAVAYEALVGSIAAAVAQRAGLPDDAVQHGRQNRWLGASGYKHQIDVSIRGPTKILLVDCKHWYRRVSVSAVLTLQGRLIDIQPTLDVAVEGAIITTAGFQSGAKQVGQHFGIPCDLARSADEWGFKYAGNLVIRPRPAKMRLSASSRSKT